MSVRLLSAPEVPPAHSFSRRCDMLSNFRSKVLSGVLTAIVMAYQHSGPIFIARINQFKSSLASAAIAEQSDCAHAQAAMRQKSPQFAPAVLRSHNADGKRGVSLTLAS